MKKATALRARVDAFAQARLLVVGDVMVDRYYSGSVRRISPEAPVPVVAVTGESQRFGGAANVAHNIRRLGAAVELCGLVGDDPEGAWLRAELARSGIGNAGIVTAAPAPTILKCRVVAHHQQVVRFDREAVGAPSRAAQRQVEEYLASIWDEIDGVVVSDYGKGLVHERLMSHLRSLNRGRRRKPVAVDPKSVQFELYRRATVITPNLGEALAAARVSGQGAATLEKAGGILLRRARGAAVLITRGEDGMTLFEAGKRPLHIPTVAQAVYDVTGAGDTVIAVVALALAAGMPLPQSAALANLAAGIVVAEFGTVPITREQLLGALAGVPG
jgi:D-beta-D-heptose 7-phosphate kinase/D-beta-D-heptose 1-phosphate adenosyltransferase